MAEYTAEYSVFVNTSWIWLSPRHVCHGRRPATMQAPPTSKRRRSTPATMRRWRSGTPTRTAPTARATSSIWPSRARAASCEARGSEGGRGAAGARYKGGGVSGSYSNYSRFRGRLSEYTYSCIIQVFRSSVNTGEYVFTTLSDHQPGYQVARLGQRGVSFGAGGLRWLSRGKARAA